MAGTGLIYSLSIVKNIELALKVIQVLTFPFLLLSKKEKHFRVPSINDKYVWLSEKFGFHNMYNLMTNSFLIVSVSLYIDIAEEFPSKHSVQNWHLEILVLIPLSLCENQQIENYQIFFLAILREINSSTRNSSLTIIKFFHCFPRTITYSMPNNI